MKLCRVALLMMLACRVASAQKAVDEGAFHGGGPLLGEHGPIAPPPMKVRWSFSTVREEAPGGGAGGNVHNGAAGIDGAPVISGAAAFVADASGGLTCLALADGKPRWSIHIDDGFGTSPLVTDGKVYIGDLGGTFYAFVAADGKKLWSFDAGNAMHSSANLVGQNIVFGTDGADIFCLSPEGKQVWNAKAGDRVNGAPAVSEGLVYVSGCDAQLRCLDGATGKERFTTDLGALAPASPAVLPDRLIVGMDQGRVTCFSTDGGKPLWAFEGVENHAMVYGSPAVDDGVAVVGARDRRIYAIELQTGKLRWKFDTRGDVDASPEISAGRVYVGSKDKHLYVLDLKTGQKLWEFNEGRALTAAPAIGQGVVIIGDTAGMVRCLEAVNGGAVGP